MTSDSGIYSERWQQLVAELAGRLEGNIICPGATECYLPLYEAKLFHQYDHRFATFHGVDEKALSGGNARETSSR